MLLMIGNNVACHGLPLYYYKEPHLRNFGDELSLKIVERMVAQPVVAYTKKLQSKKKLLALGSIFYFAAEGDVIWGSGINGKTLSKTYYTFSSLDIRAVRGPLTRQFLVDNFGMQCPEVYGDPALLVPLLFPEFQKKQNPFYDYIVIPHYKDTALFPQNAYGNIVYPTEPWQTVVEKILDSKFVVSSSLHGLIVAEAFGIPARWLRVSDKEWIFKYHDYYLGTKRPEARFATSVAEALEMGGEIPPVCDLTQLYAAFPFEFWRL